MLMVFHSPDNHFKSGCRLCHVLSLEKRLPKTPLYPEDSLTNLLFLDFKRRRKRNSTQTFYATLLCLF